MGAVQVILLPALKPGHLFLTIHPLKMKCHLPKQHQPQYFILTKVSKLFCLFFLPLFSSILQLLTGSFVNNIRTLVFVSFIRAILCILHIFKKIQILSFGIGCWIRWARYLGIPYFLFEPIVNRYAKSRYNHFFYLSTYFMSLVRSSSMWTSRILNICFDFFNCACLKKNNDKYLKFEIDIDELPST